MKADELKKWAEEEGLLDYISFHTRIFKMGSIELYKVEGKLKFYFLKQPKLNIK